MSVKIQAAKVQAEKVQPKLRGPASIVPCVLLVGCVLGMGCAAPASPPVEAPEPVEAPGLTELLEKATLVDLTYSYGKDTLYWPTSPSDFELDQLSYGPTEAGFFYSANAFCTPEHGGTHIDAPIHFAEGRHTLDEIELDRLLAPAVVIDVADKAAEDADYRLTAEDVIAWEAENGRVPEGAIVMLHTGWSKRWPDRLAYFGDDTPGDAANLHFPSYGEDSARLLVEERKVGILGVDTASIDYGPSKDFIVHQVANGADVPGFENVTGLAKLPATGAYVIALPMKIHDGSGGPVRIVALIP